ncbi:hypothetical protein LQL77_29925 [Rhodococcus cerastii]|nr:hypothetical protein [Rhodococcus cerastii]
MTAPESRARGPGTLRSRGSHEWVAAPIDPGSTLIPANDCSVPAMAG